MARDEAMHRLLLEWAQWVMVGNGSGFPSMSVLHPNWSPPSPGTTPAFKTSGASAELLRVHRIVCAMSERMRQTVWLVYCYRNLGPVEVARRLCVAEGTVHKRIELAHRVLLAKLSQKNEFRIMQESATFQAT
jgi:DNA-directed RNA polymerase specialized sigma24 family protein